MKVYKFPAVLVEMGKDAEGGVDPRPKWEYADPTLVEQWYEMDMLSHIVPYFVYRRKQKTVTINVDGVDYELPMPETKRPKYGSDYYTLSCDDRDGYVVDVFQDHDQDFNCLRNRILHLSEENVKAWAKFWNDAIIRKIKECE